jgi:hypothetical protein
VLLSVVHNQQPKFGSQALQYRNMTADASQQLLDLAPSCELCAVIAFNTWAEACPQEQELAMAMLSRSN